jgi:hypothetical protein
MEHDGGNSAALPWARSALERFRTRTAIVHIDREWLNGQDGVRCDKLTLQMLRLMT